MLNCKAVAENRSLVMLETDSNFQFSCESEKTRLQVVLLNEEPATFSAYAFTKNSSFIEKAMRVTEFLAAESVRNQNRIQKGHQMMPTAMRSYSLNILFADTYKLFLSYSVSLALVAVEFFVEILVSKLLYVARFIR